MPIYEYECSSCHHYFDLIQKFNDAPETVCPQCGETSLTKLISAAGFQLKGTGWYATDFKDKKPTKTSDSKPVSANKDAPAAETKATPTDTKSKVNQGEGS
ncbi:MAG: zinc ribbon domain-containing protein [Legionella sp.]|nr:zinc ribbon domain-containing protein [Legionella sp.]